MICQCLILYIWKYIMKRNLFQQKMRHNRFKTMKVKIKRA
ncbi:hypothetical protein CHCC20441_1802 [Bacillus licheniformis]|uniref:Uncharacterized protein n=1 Tax=Bacillus licheniformis TaxID=1402 RepID=A0A8B5YB34_BACLI|nr:hypothetical protein MUY_004009 [Bacillus licheniformis WX-02]KYC78017.1 hypothetical protein B4090_4185 [Bacillus licheniformis]TWN11059.1 hypothetical protein CHCC14564_3611 [Bacillus licheniformis LMG 17339]KYC85361.1 hypothetical protein B4091_4212 [Bacillus licheniformis]OLF97553.1 hypothetical protein B4094_0946 [Bacillus licheniformis]